MSTFSGFLKEFPTIRIDNFRKITDKPLPVVGFLSHVHTDHLQGLETWGKIPLYCSLTTQKLLLRLEKYPHRMNFAKGILESREQHYRHLKDILRPIPLNTPTEIEIGLDQFLRVTLLDANHCPGAVMFLVEDNQKAILYTGDIRSEPWWINSIARTPAILAYASGLKRLDNMYLDTTFATKDDRYRRFQTKAAGIKELLENILNFPDGTVFHFNSWTFGYEDVWIAISNALKSPVHVDDYKLLLYGSLFSENSTKFLSHEGPPLVGFMNGNRSQNGCLTDDKSVRFHSCEPGTGCSVASSSKTVRITPIIKSFENGAVLPEVGSGGGGGDLLRNRGYLELSNPRFIDILMERGYEKVGDSTLQSKIQDMIIQLADPGKQSISLDNILAQSSKGDIEMEMFLEALVVSAKSQINGTDVRPKLAVKHSVCCDKQVLHEIQFSYSRHSSYEELCELVATFQPRDIYPCTTNWQEWNWDNSIENLFGHLSNMALVHDKEMADMQSRRAVLQPDNRQSSLISCSSSQGEGSPWAQISAHHSMLNIVTQPPSFPKPPSLSSLVYPRERIFKLRDAFECPLVSVKGRYRLKRSNSAADSNASAAEALKGTSPSGWPHTIDGDLQELALYRSVTSEEHVYGTQARSMDLFDDSSSNIDDRAKGNCLSKDLPTPQDMTVSKPMEYPIAETQLTLSDSNFESQHFLEAHQAQTWRRKQAYKAARFINGAWEQEYGIICSGADHGEVELEL